MTKNTVENIRIAYASGKFDMLALLMQYKTVVNGQELVQILDYKVFPEVKQELQVRIKEVTTAQIMYAKYQDALRKEVTRSEAAEITGNKHYPFAEKAKVIRETLLEDLKELTTISEENIRGFYLPDEGHEG